LAGLSIVEERQYQLSKPEDQDCGPRCAACAGFPRLTHTFLEPNKGRTIRLYQCECGERIWDASTF